MYPGTGPAALGYTGVRLRYTTTGTGESQKVVGRELLGTRNVFSGLDGEAVPLCRQR